MEARRKSLPRGEIKINSSPKVMSLKETNVASLDKKAIVLDFEFVTDYQPEIGTVKLAGELIYVADDNEKVLAQWKKNKSLPEEVSVEVLNHLFRKCLLKASDMAEELNLPIPIQVPRVVPKEDKEQKKEEKEKK
jgi:hypothetical protein